MTARRTTHHPLPPEPTGTPPRIPTTPHKTSQQRNTSEGRTKVFDAEGNGERCDEACVAHSRQASFRHSIVVVRGMMTDSKPNKHRRKSAQATAEETWRPSCCSASRVA